MKIYKPNQQNKQTNNSQREGSVLIVVVAMLGALSLLGFLIYTISSQSEVNAEYFADSAVVLTATDVNPDVLFNFALRQLILGANEDEKMSIFYGGRNSLLPTMLGRDMQPFSGRGINYAWQSGSPGRPVVDMNYDGADDGSNPIFLTPNLSVGAQGVDVISALLVNFPDPDTGITYPGINNMFLAYDGNAPADTSDAIYPVAPDGRRVIIPSFHNPQYLRHLVSTNDLTDATAAANILRPHKSHVCIAPDGTITTTGRFIFDATDALDPAGDSSVPAVAAGPFPNLTGASTFKEGVWDDSRNDLLSDGIDNTDPFEYEYDVDTTGDGVKKSIYLDLHYPILTKPNGDKYIPMVAMHIVDADGLMNLNVHGNHYGQVDIADNPFGGTDWISQSNEGISPSEVNIQYGLNASPVLGDFSGSTPAELATALEQHRYFYRPSPGYLGDPGSAEELSNMEMFWLLAGRADFDTGSPSVIDILYEGRWGNKNRLDTAITTLPRNVNNFPLPGTAGVDDNNNLDEGSTFEHPLDFFCAGSAIANSTLGKVRYLTLENRLNLQSYADYLVNPTTGWLGANTLHSNNLLVPSSTSQLGDEPAETLIEPALAASQVNDSIFSSSENAALQMTDSDRATAGNTGRLLLLAPYNFVSCVRAESIRKRFTTTSWDLQAFGTAYYGSSATADKFREWEFYDPSAPLTPTFPPKGLLGADPFRPELRELLSLLPNDQAVKRLQRKLSINGILEYDGSGELRFRPLTEHPTSLGNSVVATLSSPPSVPEEINNTTDREWLARYDRQRMARDIYVLLYMFGGGKDNVNYATTATPYTTNELKEMAQFAVNMVDALDPDSTITLFEYDTDLSDGWDVDDNAYLDTGDSDREIVYGVEKQLLTLNESMAILTDLLVSDHTSTKWDDSNTDLLDYHDFFYLELENVSPYPVTIADGQWQIIVKPTNPAIGEERRLTLLSDFGTFGVGTASRKTIGTAGDNGLLVAGLPSHFNVDFDGGTTYKQIVPLDTDSLEGDADPDSDLDVDLMMDFTTDLYRVHREHGTAALQDNDGNGGVDGPEVNDPVVPTNPPSNDLLAITDAASAIGGGENITIILRRRADLTRSEPTNDPATGNNEAQSEDNPWVTVDTMEIPISTFVITPAATSTDIQTELATMKSKERLHPLFGENSELVDGTSTGLHQFHSIGAVNVAEADKVSFWQPIYDRDFASPIELFQIPTYGPAELTEKLAERYVTGITELRLPVDTPTIPAPDYVNSETAGRKFLHPGEMLNADPDNNRWHRVLNFVEVPSRLHRHLDVAQSYINIGNVNDDTLGFYRVPGKINLNGIRYPEVIAGLVDDLEVVNYNLVNQNIPAGDVNDIADVDNDISVVTPGLAGPDPSPLRDWWNEFLKARDGRDPESPAGTNHYYPGLPTSKPFRSMNYAQGKNGIDNLNHTILRALPKDGTDFTTNDEYDAALDRGDDLTNDKRRYLFEIGTSEEHKGTGSIGPSHVDLVSKNRLLQKVYNNTTTRSNVFFAFIQIDFFEAVEVVDTGRTVVRIGGPLGTPGYRRFYVIDRSKALDLLNSTDLPDTTGSTFTFSFNQNFNYKSLILHTQQIN